DLLHREERVGAADAQVARGREVERAADAAALDRADDRKARLVERGEAVHELAQRLLEAEPLARRLRAEREFVAGEDVERHAGGEVLAGRRDDERARLAAVAERTHR